MYLLNFDIAVQDLLVPDKRTPKTVALNKGLVAVISTLQDNIINTYKNANLSLTAWDGSPIDRNQNVLYGKSVFQSQVDANVSEPTFSDTWVPITDNYLGNDFRLAIRGERLILEYALNVWFETVFRQPPLQSDIYTTTNTILAVPVFRVGITEDESSDVYSNTSSELVINAYSFTNQYNMAIYIPVAVFNALGVNDNIRETIVRSFADKYINVGITYQIITY